MLQMLQMLQIFLCIAMAPRLAEARRGAFLKVSGEFKMGTYAS